MADEKLVLVEATGARMGIGGYGFTERTGYEFPVAEMPVSVAARIVKCDENGQKEADASAIKKNKILAKKKADGTVKKGTPITKPHQLCNFRFAVEKGAK